MVRPLTKWQSACGVLVQKTLVQQAHDSMQLQRFIAVALGAAALANCQPASARDDRQIKVMTFNLRYASDKPPNAWAARRLVMRALIEDVRPDVMGTQEGMYRQIKDLAADLPEYAWIGMGRDGGSRGEFMAVFYRRERFEPLEFDHFWLSDTPDRIGSTTWGNSNRRMVTWVRFRELEGAQEFYFLNTHFDHQVQAARQKSTSWSSSGSSNCRHICRSF